MMQDDRADRAPAPNEEPSTVQTSDWELPLIEVGWVLAGQLSPEDWDAIQYARDRLRELLSAMFPAFGWVMPLVHRRELVQQQPVTAVSLLEAGSSEREVARWDYAFVITEADLRGHYKPYMLGAPSLAFSVGVMSTSRLDPASLGVESTSAERTEVMTRRLIALAIHMFGHINHLHHSQDPNDFMFNLDSVDDLDNMTTLSATSTLSRVLGRVADVRLEEMGPYQNRQGFAFAFKVIVREWREVVASLIEIAPWWFPLRLSKLTTAAVSTLLILINTAEAWDLGMSQSPLAVTVLSLLTLTGTSAFILYNQRLLANRNRGLTEQRVVSGVAILLGMGVGMLTTYMLLFAGTLVLAWALFSPVLIQGWAPAIQQLPTLEHYLTLAGFVASLGLIIGAMGASFESEDYIRHVTFIDEET